MPALKKTPANSHAPEQRTEQQPEQQPEQQLRVTMLPAPALETIYANAFQTNYSHGEILLTACVSLGKRSEHAVLSAFFPVRIRESTRAGDRCLLGGSLSAFWAAAAGPVKAGHKIPIFLNGFCLGTNFWQKKDDSRSILIYTNPQPSGIRHKFGIPS